MQSLLCPEFRVRLGGRPLPVYSTGVASFAICEIAGATTIEVELQDEIAGCILHPLRIALTPKVQGRVATFDLERAENLWVEIPGARPLYLFTHAPAKDIPDPKDPAVHYFSSGSVHEVDILELGSNETLYVETGAVLRGAVRASGENIRICGGGIIDGAPYGPDNRRNIILAEGCKNLRIEDVTLIHPSSWMVVLAKCEDVTISNLHEIGEIVTSDGVDIVGSKRVHIKGGFFRNNDDCIVVKSLEGWPPDRGFNWTGNVEDVLAEGCTLWNDHAGNAMEIGFETRAESIRGITFRDIDVIGAHGTGAVFSIHPGDRACISDVLWENIRVEHFWEKLVDLRILQSRYSRDPERGQIRNVTFRNVQTVPDIHNTPSLIGGWSSDHLVENVSFENFRIGDRHILDEDALHLFTKHAKRVSFS